MKLQRLKPGEIFCIERTLFKGHNSTVLSQFQAVLILFFLGLFAKLNENSGSSKITKNKHSDVMEVYFYTNYALFSNALVVVKFILDSLIVQQPSLLHKKGMKFLEND